MYLFAGQVVIHSDLSVKENDFSKFLTGKLKYNIYGDLLKFEISKPIKSIKFHFDEKIIDLAVISNKIEKFNAVTSSDKRWIIVNSTNYNGLLNKKIKLSLSGIKYSGMPLNRKIDLVEVNDNPISMYEFYYHILNDDYSNLSLYYPFDINNISNWMASSFGEIIISLIKSILIILFIFQLSLFFVLVLWKNQTLNIFFSSPEANSAITWIDNISENFSVHLGFLGTVMSLWVSLEMATVNFQSFGNIIHIMKDGIFTTVLGLSIRVICTSRGVFLYKKPVDD